MAELRFYKNIFEDTYESVEYNLEKTLQQYIEEYASSEAYTDTLVECYDIETGETFYSPICDDTEPSVMISTEGKDLPITYQVLPDDIINIVYLPLGNGGGTEWDWGGAFLGSLGMSVVYGIAGAVLGGWPGFAVGAIVGGILGFAGGGLLTPLIMNTAEDSSSSSIGKKEGKSLPDVRGSENQSLLNQPFPCVLGKHLITPAIVGDPYTTYEGDNGEEAYIRTLYLAGYGPLKLTDFKLGDMMLAYNRDASAPHPTVLSGALTGTSGKGDDSGLILDRWSNNDIELEIIQQPSATSSIYRGNVYPNKVVDKQIDANVLYVADGDLDKIAQVTYKGTLFANKFRTNGVFFTEQCPKKFRVTLTAPQGLYATRTHTKTQDKKSLSEVEYTSIPLWYAIQWRPYNDGLPTSDPTGGDFYNWKNIYVWNKKNLKSKYDKSNLEKDIAAHRGNTLSLDSATYHEKQILQPLDAITKFLGYSKAIIDGENSGIEKPSKTSWENNGIKIRTMSPNSLFSRKGDGVTKVGYLTNYAKGTTGAQSGYCATVTKTIKNTVLEAGKLVEKNVTETTLYINIQCADSKTDEHITTATGSTFSYQEVDTTVTLYNYFSLDDDKLYDSDGNFIERPEEHTEEVKINRIAVFGTVHKDSILNSYSLAQAWLDKDLCNFQYAFSGEDNISEMRLTAEVDVFGKDGISPEDLMRPENKINGIEIRCIRISPNYLDQHNLESQDNSDRYSAETYSDIIKLTSIQTEVFNKQTYLDSGTIDPVRSASDEDYRSFCYIALKAKADTAGYINQSMKKLNCVAESFAPYYDNASHTWKPENVMKTYNYYGYYDSDNNPCNRADMAIERVISKSVYEEGRRKGFDWVQENNGTTFKSKINSIVFSRYESIGNHKYYILPDEAAPYITANSASIFLLGCVGPQNKSAGRGYKQVDLLALSEWYEDCKDVTDGSTYSEDTVFEGTLYPKGSLAHFKYECNAYLTTAQKLEDLLAKIAITGRAVYTVNNFGQIQVIMDKPIDYPVGVISSQTLVNGGSNTYSYENLPAALRFEFSDENDGYNKNNVYCYADGYNPQRYHGSIEPCNIDFVTNPKQVWSLGRYILACRLQGREVLTRKVGMEGNTFGLGDVVLVQDDSLLIGSGSARIQEVIEDSASIYGFITDSTFDTRKNINGVTVFQPEKFGKSRIVTKDVECKTVKVGNVDYTMNQGVTNVIILKTPLVKYTGSDPSASSYEKINFKTGDIVMLGEIDKISAPYRITKIKPEKDGTFTETLCIYDEKFYNYGARMPSFQSYITEPDAGKDPIVLSTEQTVAERANMLASQNNMLLNFSVNNREDLGTPDPVVGVTCKAEKLKIISTWISPLSADGAMRNNISHYIYKFKIGEDGTGNAIWTEEFDTANTAVEYSIGYLEKQDLVVYGVMVKCINVANKESEWSDLIPVDTSAYGTWKLNKPSLAKITAYRDYLELKCEYEDKENFYGTTKFRYELKYNENVRVVRENDQKIENYVFNRLIDGYPERQENALLTADGIEVPLLSSYTLTVYAVCIETEEECSNEDISILDTSHYGTWIPPQLDTLNYKSYAIETGVAVDEELPVLPEERIGDNEGYYGQPYSRQYQFIQDKDDSELEFRNFNDIRYDRYNFVREPSEVDSYYDGYPEAPESYYGREIYIDAINAPEALGGMFTDYEKNLYVHKPKFMGRARVRGRYYSSVVNDRYGNWSAESSISWDGYKTWIPEYKKEYCSVKSNKRSVTFVGEQAPARPVYGNVQYGILVAKTAQEDLDGNLQYFDMRETDSYDPCAELNTKLEENHLTEDTRRWKASAVQGVLDIYQSGRTVYNPDTKTLEVTTQTAKDLYNWYNIVKLSDKELRLDEDSYKRASKEETPKRIQDMISWNPFNQNDIITTWVSRSHMQEMPLIGQNYLMYQLECSVVLRDCEGESFNTGNETSPSFYDPFTKTTMTLPSITFSHSMEPYQWTADVTNPLTKEVERIHYWAMFDSEENKYKVHYYKLLNSGEQETLTYIKTDAMETFVSPVDSDLVIVTIPEFADYATLEKDQYLETEVDRYYKTVKYKLTRIEMSDPIKTEYRFKIMIRNASSGYSRLFDDGDDANVIDFEVNANSVADLVDSSITHNKLTENCITADNIAAGTITAEHIATVDLLAKGATVGMLSAEGIKVDDAGFWASKPFVYEYHGIGPTGFLDYEHPKSYTTEAGEFFVGNTLDVDEDGAEYLHYIPSAHSFEFKISNFKVTAVQSIIKGAFSVKDKLESDLSAFFSINPSDSEEKTLGLKGREIRVGKKASGSVSARHSLITVNGSVSIESETVTVAQLTNQNNGSVKIYSNLISLKDASSKISYITQTTAGLELGISDNSNGNVTVKNSSGKSITLIDKDGNQTFNDISVGKVTATSTITALSLATNTIEPSSGALYLNRTSGGKTYIGKPASGEGYYISEDGSYYNGKSDTADKALSVYNGKEYMSFHNTTTTDIKQLVVSNNDKKDLYFVDISDVVPEKAKSAETADVALSILVNPTDEQKLKNGAIWIEI